MHSGIDPNLTELIIHISQGCSDEMVKLLTRYPTLTNLEHASGTPPLYYAVRHQTPHIAAYLIQAGANVNPPLPGRESLTQMADALPDQDILDGLIAAGGRPKSRRKLSSETKPVVPTIAELKPADLPLCATVDQPAKFARLAGEFKVRRLRQLLTWACRERAEAFAQSLIPCLSTVDYCTDAEGSPLLEAALSGSLELVKSLRAAGSKRELVGAFDFAVARGHVSVTAELLEEIQSKKHKNYFQRESPSMAEKAATRGYTVMAELLLPFASKRSRTIAIRKIEEWREKYHDLVPEQYTWESDQPIPPG